MSNNPYNNNFVSGGYFYNPILRDITMVKGDTLSFAFQVQGLKGQTPEKIYLSVKAAIEDRNLLFNVSSDDYIKFREYDEENDLLTYVVRIPPYLTADIDLGRYFYDLEMQVNQDNITLMKGRFTLDYEITGDNPEPPIYENGDIVRYPTTTEVGVVKLYTERYISEIGQAIIDINGLSQRYTTQEMSGALEDIKNDIDDIRAALAASLGTDPNIPLEDIPSVVSSDKIVSKFEYCKKWFSRYNESRDHLESGLAYYLTPTTYGIIPTISSVKMGVKVQITQADGLYCQTIAINNNLPNANCGNRNDLSVVLDNYVPYWQTDFSTGGCNLINKTSLDDIPFLNAGSLQIAEYSEEGSLPLFNSLLANERECTASELRERLDNVIFTDLVNIGAFDNLPCDLSSVFGVVLVAMNAGTYAIVVMSNEEPTHTLGAYNTDTNNYTGMTGYYNEMYRFDNMPKYDKVSMRDFWGPTVGWFGGNRTLEFMSNLLVLHNEPLRDQKGNTLIPANYTLDKFGF